MTGKQRLKTILVGDDALLAAYEGSGVFWMPNGLDMMDFTVKGLLCRRTTSDSYAHRFSPNAWRRFTTWAGR